VKKRAYFGVAEIEQLGHHVDVIPVARQRGLQGREVRREGLRHDRGRHGLFAKAVRLIS
jgi:hypothetical protein